jgi:HEPN domain-containing protein
MGSLTNRDFLRAAGQRLAAAKFLLRGGFNRDALYLAGYTVECSLKAVILSAVLKPGHPKTPPEINTNNLEKLVATARLLGEEIPIHIVRRFRKGPFWSTDLRYETRRVSTADARTLLRTAERV